MLGIGKLACACALCHGGSRADDDLMVMVSEREARVRYSNSVWDRSLTLYGIIRHQTPG